jgi:hypothetical protein
MSDIIAAAIITVLGSILLALIALFRQHKNDAAAARKDNAEAAESVANAATTLLKPLEERVTKLEAMLRAIRDWNCTNQAKMRKAGISPMPFDS